MGTARVRILTTHPKDNHPRWRERTEVLPGWLDEAARSGDAPMRYGRSLYWGWKLFRASRHFDAVVTGFERPWWVYAALQRFRRRRVPHVVVYVSFVLPRHRLRRALKRFYYRWLLYPLVLKQVDRIVVFSRYQTDLYATMLGARKGQFVHVPYHTTLYDTRYVSSEGDYVFAGGDFTRDYASLIEAARGLPYRVMIAARFRHYFEGLDVPRNVEILTTTRQGFIDLMAGARVVVVPLRGGLLHSGGQQTYLNAMLMGKPVIVADDCGADEYVTHDRSGMLLAPGDASSLRVAIRTLMEDRDRARGLGREARLAAQAHSPERFIQSALGVVADCVNGRKLTAENAHAARG
jgi:glycosyltransferase involved in cell wall biosynthesis